MTRTIKLAYRDNDRTPVIYCIREMARLHYDLDVEVLRVHDEAEFESSLFTGAADVLIEHHDFLFARAAEGSRIVMFCAPVIETGLELVARPGTVALEELRGGVIAVREQGRPQIAVMRLKAMGLEDAPVTIVSDREAGRWGLWRKVVDGDCVAAFVTRLYLRDALEAGLVVVPSPDIEIVSTFAQGCLGALPEQRPDDFGDYVRATLHALHLIKHRPDEAFEIACGEPMRLMEVEERGEMRRRYEAIVAGINEWPYPTDEAVRTSFANTVAEFPSAAGVDPVEIWDLHWVRDLEATGFLKDWS